jgi:hypothetical protein
MKAILYFGHHKVGSTALQSFLYQNQVALMRQGLLYPGVDFESLSLTLARLLGELDISADQAAEMLEAQTGPTPMNAREPHNALAFQMIAQTHKGKAPDWHPALPGTGQMIRALRMQQRFLRPSTVVLCSEVMSNFGADHPELIDRVREIYPEAEYSLYCVLRRPDEYLVSWHAQRLRFGDKMLPLNGGAAQTYIRGIHFDYRKVVEPWRDRFPGATLHLRNYTDVLKSGGSVEDFFDKTGLEMPSGAIPAGRANESLPRAAMEIARRANQDLPPREAQEMRQYLLTCDRHVTPVPNRDVEMFGAEIRAELAERFAPIHDWLSAEIGRPFFPDLNEMTRTLPVPEAEATADLLARLPLSTLPNETLRSFIRTLAREQAA